MEDIKTVLLVVNPISGSIDKAELAREVKKQVLAINASLSIFRTTGKDDKANLSKTIKELKPCRILAAGGDGTIKLAAEALKGHKIPLGILPAGSANGLAKNLFLPVTLSAQIRVALENNYIEMDIITIDDEYCLHMSDFGLNAELIKEYQESKIRGKFGYLLQSIPTLVNSDYPFQFKIEANGKTIEKEAILLGIANARSYGTGATVNPKGKMDDGVFELLIFKNFDVVEILKTLRNEVNPDPDFLETISTNSAHISCSSPVAFQVDGEFLGNKTDIKVGIIPNSLLIAVPRKMN